MQMTLACTDSGATFTSLWSGEAIDRSDKSISKAAVSAVKYYLLKTFLLAGGDEEDADASSPEIVHGSGKATEQRATEPKPAKAQAKSAPRNESFHDEPPPMDNPFDDAPPADEPAKPAVLTDAELKRFNTVGVELYGKDEWEEQRPKLVKAVSNGKVDSSKKLTSAQAAQLIRGMEKKIAEVATLKAQQAAQAQPADAQPVAA